MTATMQVQQPGVDEEHRQAYAAALAMYEKERGRPADHHWRGLLYILTSNPEIWDALRPHLEMKQGRLARTFLATEKQAEDLFDPFSRGDQYMIVLAIYLYGGIASVTEFRGFDLLPLPDVLRSLDERNIEIYMGALREFCSVS